MVSTVYNHRLLIAAMLKFYGGAYPVIGELLSGAAPLLWRDFLRAGTDRAAPRKVRFGAQYVRHCVPLLETVIVEWIEEYGCNVAFRDFYAKKLLDCATAYMLGERYTGQLKQLFESKPRVGSLFFYDNDAWEALER